MEVKEAIECLEVASEFQVSINRQEEIKRVISLLKSLESENKKLKKENEAYKGMWKEFKKGYSRDGVYFYHDCSDDNDEYVNDVIRELEQTYLGGGE